jgi:uncharacterized damage-inducible protein DinB
MDIHLSYPIGQFVKPSVIDAFKIEDWINQIEELPARLYQEVSNLNDHQLNTPYRPQGWTVRQVVHHLPDSHMNSYVRFHWALTEDQPVIKAYHEAAWAELPYLQNLAIDTSLTLLSSIHQRWVDLLKSLTKEDLKRTLIHPENKETFLLQELIGMYAWHGEHHLAQITQLKKRKAW